MVAIFVVLLSLQRTLCRWAKEARRRGVERPAMFDGRIAR
jgi:hypothetical protein